MANGNGNDQLIRQLLLQKILGKENGHLPLMVNRKSDQLIRFMLLQQVL